MKLLLLEDDRRLQTIVARGLRRSGHVVDVAGTVAEARWSIGETQHDVLVLDVMLPDGDGFTLCGDLRDAGDTTPVLMLTARDAVVDRVRGLDVGADDYLVKPFAFVELEARLRALDRRGPVSRPGRLRVGSLEIDAAARTAQVGTRDLHLTTRAFALLDLFARHVGEVMTRQVILDQVWDWAFEGDLRIIDVYVRTLRLALGDAPGTPRLETIRGTGYVLRAVPRSGSSK